MFYLKENFIYCLNEMERFLKENFILRDIFFLVKFRSVICRRILFLVVFYYGNDVYFVFIVDSVWVRR